MKMPFFKKKAYVLVYVFVWLTVSWLPWGQIGPCYVEAPLEKELVENASLYFFFDKTESMRGFVEKGDASNYVKALPLLWQTADAVFITSSAHFYEYGETSTNEFKSANAIAGVKGGVLRPGFYGYGYSEAGTLVKENKGQPFSAVADYIKALNEPAGSAYIVVTDLYEQNRENPFPVFFRDAFSRGLSGAFFAVQSSFTGNIHSVSAVNTRKSIYVRDGEAVFFICIVGDNDIVYSYSAELGKEFTNRKIDFNSAVFIADSAKDIELSIGEPVMAGNARRFGDKENAFRQVNIRPESKIFVLTPPPPPIYLCS
jgi:hypothetical protein